MNAHGTVGEGTITNVLARVVTDAAVNRGQRVIFNQLTPRALVVSGLGERQPRLNILAGGAGIIAGRQEINIFRPARAQRARTFTVARQVRALCEIGVQGVGPL